MLLKADRWFPSTKQCSKCGNIQDMKLDERTYKCEKCKVVIGRDYNAAINLNNYGKNSIPGPGTKDCGLVSSGTKHRTKLTKMKQ